MSVEPNDKSITLLDHILTVIEGNDKRYMERFAASDQAVAAALSAQKELTGSAFQSSEKAIVKAEDAQREYNVRSNEFRGQLDDQAKRLMPRTETEAKFLGVDEKFTGLIKSIDERFVILNKALEEKNEGIKISFEKSIGSILNDIKSLRESRSGTEGKGAGATAIWGYLIAGFAAFCSIISIVILILKSTSK